jgi:hypothetical protein
MAVDAPIHARRRNGCNVMNAFDDSLGVQCIYCHVERDGRLDFASDNKREKRVARQMILLRDSINVVLPLFVKKVLQYRFGIDANEFLSKSTIQKVDIAGMNTKAIVHHREMMDTPGLKTIDR